MMDVPVTYAECRAIVGYCQAVTEQLRARFGVPVLSSRRHMNERFDLYWHGLRAGLTVEAMALVALDNGVMDCQAEGANISDE